MRVFAFAVYVATPIGAFFWMLGQATRIEWWTPLACLLLVSPIWGFGLFAGVVNLYDNHLGVPLLRWSFWRGTWVEPPRRLRCRRCGGGGWERYLD